MSGGETGALPDLIAWDYFLSSEKTETEENSSEALAPAQSSLLALSLQPVGKYHIL